MKTLKELKNMLGLRMTEKKELEEKRSKAEGEKFTPDQEKRYKEVLDDMEGLLNEIDVLERAAKIDQRTADPGAPALEIRNVAADAKYSFGEFLVDIARDTTGHGRSARLDVHQKRNFELARVEARASGLNESVPSEGGFLVGTDFNAELVKKVHETGILLGRTKKVPIGAGANGLKMNTIDETSRATGSRWGGIRVYRKNEAATATASKPKWGRLELALEKMIGIYYATDELIMDATALESVVTQGFAEEFGFKSDDEIVNGTGAGEMLGMLISKALVSVSKQNGQSAKTIVYENIADMWARMWSKAKPNSVWLINTDVNPQLQTMTMVVGTGGVPVYLPPAGASGAPYGTLMGRPIIEIEQCATLGTVGDIILADLGQYLTIEKGGMQAASSIHVQFLTDETAFRFVMRNNGQPLWDKALTPYKGSNTVSPFVALETRS